MRSFLLILVAPVALFGASGAVSQARIDTRTVAVTFDDLPANAAGMVANDVASLTAMTRKLLTAVSAHGVPAVGFVNEGKLFHPGAAAGDAEERIGVLRMWLDAGLELGNHTYSHRDLNHTPLEDFQADVVRGAAVTRKLAHAAGIKYRYFRHPFLHVGGRIEQRRAFEAFLAARGYTIAPVTIDNDDFVYAAAYANALRRGDTATAARIGDDYLRYMDEVFSYFEAASRRVLGREIPHVLILHANALNADRFDALAAAIVRRGYRFISLEEALQDKAYSLPDTFIGAPSNSWLNHWEITAGRAPIPTPRPAEWIGKAAGQ
jgi:peptidoglycan/xylan/chitin deacetylase (PgdA/CDA1 family)